MRVQCPGCKSLFELEEIIVAWGFAVYVEVRCPNCGNTVGISRPIHKPKHGKTLTDTEMKAKRLWYSRMRAGLKCIGCGKLDTLDTRLHFHHRVPAQKTISISKAINSRSWSVEMVKEEIKKCDCLCANCHSLEHKQLVDEAETLSFAF